MQSIRVSLSVMFLTWAAFNQKDVIFTGIFPLSALIALKEKRKSENELIQKLMQDFLSVSTLNLIQCF